MVLFDLDNTLLRTGMLTKLALLDLAQTLRQPVEHLYEVADKMEWQYSMPALLEALMVPADHRADHLRRYRAVMQKQAESCLFPRIAEALRSVALREDVGLLTRGVVSHQQEKVAALTVITELIPEARRHFVLPHGQKSVVVAELLRSHEQPIAVVEDTIAELLDLQVQLPESRVSLVRMDWPERKQAPHVMDGVLWRVARSAEELVALLTEQR